MIVKQTRSFPLTLLLEFASLKHFPWTPVRWKFWYTTCALLAWSVLSFSAAWEVLQWKTSKRVRNTWLHEWLEGGVLAGYTELLTLNLKCRKILQPQKIRFHSELKNKLFWKSPLLLTRCQHLGVSKSSLHTPIIKISGFSLWLLWDLLTFGKWRSKWRVLEDSALESVI